MYFTISANLAAASWVAQSLSRTRDQTHFVFIFSLIHGAVDHPAGIHLSIIMLSGWSFEEDAAA